MTMYDQDSTSSPPLHVKSSTAMQVIDSSSADELGSHYNQGATTSDITLVAPQMQPYVPRTLREAFEAVNSDITLVASRMQPHNVPSLLDKCMAELDFTYEPARMAPIYDYCCVRSPDPVPLNHIPRPDCPLPVPSPLDSLLDYFQFDSSASALSHPNDPRPVIDHTTEPVPRAQCEFKMYRPEPPNDDPIELRRENRIELGVSLRTGPDKVTLPWKFIRTSNTGAVECSGTRRGRGTLDFALEVRGATTGTLITSACPKCSKKASSGPPNCSLLDFVAKDNLVQITGGNARIVFRFRCLPPHHGTTDREYRLSVTISDGGRILGQHQYPNWLRIVHHLNRGKSRLPIALQQANETSSVVELGESEESHDAPLNARFSGGSTSGTSAGGPLPVQPSRTPAQSPEFNTFTRTHPAGEGFEPGWRRSGLPASTSARSNNRIHEKSPVLSHINPRRGSTKGGDEIYLIVRDLPPTTDLYARFGGEIVPTSRLAPGVLSCRLPAAVHPGVVEVTLCQTPSLHDEGHGKSLVSFEYEEDSSEVLTAWWNTFNNIDPRINIGPAVSPGILATSHLDV